MVRWSDGQMVTNNKQIEAENIKATY